MIYEILMITSFYIQGKHYKNSNILGVFDTQKQCLVAKHQVENVLKKTRVEYWIQDAHISAFIITCEDINDEPIKEVK